MRRDSTRMPLLVLRTATVLVALCLLVSIVPAGEIPSSLRDIVFGAGHRTIVDATLDGVAFRGLAPFSDVPYLLWPDESATTTYDHDRAAEWIRRVGAELGHNDFEPRYVETWSWRSNEVWTYELVRGGVPLFDARVMLHWQDGSLVGVVNAVPLPIQSIEEADPSKPVEGQVYVPRRQGTGYALELGQTLHQIAGDRIHVSVVVGGETVRRIVEPISTPEGEATFEEWPLPAGTFPDQIDIDSSGLVWFSQPLEDWVTSFDPATEIFTQYSTGPVSTPDGMMVDGNDVLWTGLQSTNEGLGKFEVDSSNFTPFDPPYAGATSPIDLRSTPPIVTLLEPPYVDGAPIGSLLFYAVEPLDNLP